MLARVDSGAGRLAAEDGGGHDTLAAHLGRRHALDTIWYICWCNYMTRVADAFQIPLERENVFAEPKADR